MQHTDFGATIDLDARVGAMPERRYWFDALVVEVSSIWGAHRRWGSIHHLEELCYYAALTTFYDADRYDIRNRRRLLYYYLSGVFATESPDDPLVIHAHKLPIDSFVPKVVDNLCDAYSDAPTRTWGGSGSVNDSITTTLRDVYKAMGADGRLQSAYRYAKLCSGVAVRPYIDARGGWRVAIIPPDMFRYETDDNGDVLTMVVIPTRRYDEKGNPETVFQVWNDQAYWEEDYRGNRRLFMAPATEQMVSEIVNPYGRVPYELLRLVEPNNDDTFGGGLFSLVEGVLACNMLRFAEDCSAVLESWGQWVAVNMGFSDKGGARLGFGRMTAVDGVQAPGEGGTVPPTLDHVAAVGQHINIAQTRKSRARELMRGEGIPDSIASDQGATPASGLARALERAELLERRRADIALLAPFEQRFSDLTITVYNTDGPGRMGASKLPTAVPVSTDFADEQILDDPSKRWEMNTRRLLAGVMTPSQYVKLEMGVDYAISNEAAIAMIEANQKLVDPIRVVLGAIGGAPLNKDVGVQTAKQLPQVEPTKAVENLSTEQAAQAAQVPGSA
ncbi:MAG: phage portal protein [Candidatus Kapaibacterium sp.]